MRRCAIFLVVAAAAAQQPDVFGPLHDTAEARETEWKQADEQLKQKIAGEGLCASGMKETILATHRKSTAALDAQVEYYRAWRNYNDAILGYQRGSAKSAALELQKIKSELEHSREDLAHLERRAAELAEAGVAASRLASLRQLIDAAKASQRNWIEVLHDFETEEPERRKGIARMDSLVKSIDRTIAQVEEQRRWYELWYNGRIDSVRTRCPNGL